MEARHECSDEDPFLDEQGPVPRLPTKTPKQLPKPNSS